MSRRGVMTGTGKFPTPNPEKERRSTAMYGYFVRALHDKRGFTLIELVVVMAIVAILVVAALPSYRGSRERAYLAEPRQVGQEFKTLAWGYFIERATFAGLTADAIGLNLPNSNYWQYAVSENGTSASLNATGRTGTAIAGRTYRLTINNTGAVTECGDLGGLPACTP